MITLRSNRIFALSAVLAFFGAGSIWIASGQSAPGPATPTGEPAFVVAELFTSEGCSSCPPADEILNGLLQRQPFTSITVLGLSEHVDYWNRDGWVDPFSSADFTKRQLDYRSHAFHSNVVYTPQLVVDGFLEHVGNDSRGVYRTILQASQVPKANVSLAASVASAGAMKIGIQVTLPDEVLAPNNTDVMIAITEDNLAADVHGGENGGQHLKHNGVVRKLINVGTLKPPARNWSGNTSVTLPPGWKAQDLRVVGFLQEQDSRRIVAAGWSKVAGPTAAP